jgi:DNA repair exonuclease SbcCD ATPase subunit
VGAELEQQLEQLEELLSLFDGHALREAQEAIEHQIASLTERLEVTRQALAQAQAQRRRLARARLLLEEVPGGSGDHPPAASPAAAAAPSEPATAPDRRRGGERRKEERRKEEPHSGDSYATGA